MNTPTAKIEKLEKQHARAEKLINRRQKALDDAKRERRRIEQQLRRERLALLVGQPVKRRIRRYSEPQLNDAVGTLVSVRRTRCTIDYGDLGEWSMPIDDVGEVTELQGGEILFSMGAKA